MRTVRLALAALLAGAAPAAAQDRALARSALAPPPAAEAAGRPPLSGGDVAFQLLAAGGGALAGALVISSPFLLAGLGGRSVNDDAALTAVVLGYFGGTVLATRWAGHALGLTASPWATVGGAVAGVIGGPVLLVTVPVGAVVGYDLTRRRTRPLEP